jgi:hypothetical protein
MPLVVRQAYLKRWSRPAAAVRRSYPMAATAVSRTIVDAGGLAAPRTGSHSLWLVRDEPFGDRQHLLIRRVDRRAVLAGGRKVLGNLTDTNMCAIGREAVDLLGALVRFQLRPHRKRPNGRS